jgi:hypothetical protein
MLEDKVELEKKLLAFGEEARAIAAENIRKIKSLIGMI